jgi:hypothetical protein
MKHGRAESAEVRVDEAFFPPVRRAARLCAMVSSQQKLEEEECQKWV